MKKKILLAVLVLFSSFSLLMAQGPKQKHAAPEEKSKKTVEKLKPELNLTEQQEKDITPVYTDFYTSMSKLKEGGAKPPKEERQKLAAERDEKLKKILSEDQMKKLDEYEEKMRQEHKKSGGGGQ